jgi:hypothetical protein
MLHISLPTLTLKQIYSIFVNVTIKGVRKLSKNLTIKVIESQSKQTLFECELHEIDKAYEYASQMEQLGLDIKIIKPSITRELSHSLGVSEADWAKIANALDDEISDHVHDQSGSNIEEIDSCCVEKKKLS